MTERAIFVVVIVVAATVAVQWYAAMLDVVRQATGS